MTTTAGEITGSSISRIAGQDELAAADVTQSCGKFRLCAEVAEVASAFVVGAVTVGTTAVALRVGVANLADRRSVLLQNLGVLPVFIGGSDVTTLTGIRIDAGASIVLDLTAIATVYGISSGTGNSVRVMELS